MYEQREEFEAAAALAHELDAAPIMHPRKAVGGEASFQAGLAMYYGILEATMSAPPALVEAAENALSEAVQTESLQAKKRWVAGILAGKLAGEYRYDDAAAARYFSQAGRATEPNTLEAMSALWWRARLLVQQHRNEEADGLLRAINDDCAARWPRSHVVVQTASLLRKGSR
jgi:hypothetical protein